MPPLFLKFVSSGLKCNCEVGKCWSVLTKILSGNLFLTYLSIMVQNSQGTIHILVFERESLKTLSINSYGSNLPSYVPDLV